jgi:hypothetical protein
MKEKVIPKIRTRLYWKKNEEIRVRHDGAKPHYGRGNSSFFAKWGQMYKWNIVKEIKRKLSVYFAKLL